MSAIKIMCEILLSCGVIPKDKPTVPIAEAVSNRQVRIGRSSILLMSKPPVKNRIRYIIKIVEACATVSFDTRLLKKHGFYIRRKTAMAFASRTATVVVFMPPAVDPGEPPISIKSVMTDCPVSLTDVKSAVLNPAVLGVIA